MLQTVLIFAAVTAVFEFVALARFTPRLRQWLLSHDGVLHAFVIAANLMIHWGTITGSMTAVVAGLASYITVPIAQQLWGHYRQHTWHPGILQALPV